MLANIAERHWPLTAREDLASEAETDAEYFRRRSGEESRAAEKADGLAACTAHTELADLHRLVGRVARNGMPRLRFGSIERREALLNDALDNSFPASDPPAFVAPADPALALISSARPR